MKTSILDRAKIFNLLARVEDDSGFLMKELPEIDEKFRRWERRKLKSKNFEKILIKFLDQKTKE